MEERDAFLLRRYERSDVPCRGVFAFPIPPAPVLHLVPIWLQAVAETAPATGHFRFTNDFATHFDD